MKKFYIIILVLLSLSAGAIAQEKITLKDAKEIKLQVKQTIKHFEGLMNFITSTDLDEASLPEYIANSYSDSSRNKVFYKSISNIEDDSEPTAARGNALDVPAQKYLNEIDIKYKKTEDPSITFSNLNISNVKKKEFLYIRVKFQSTFGSRYKINNSRYPVRQREATLRLERAGGNKWTAYISNVGFFDPANPIESPDNDVQVKLDSVSARVVTPKQLDSLEKEDSLKVEAEAQKTEAAYQGVVTEANNNLSSGQYQTALDLYIKAQGLKPGDLSLYGKIQKTKKLIYENSFDYLKNEANKAKDLHNYELAVQYFKRAVAADPKNGSGLDKSEISPLLSKISELNLPKNYWQAGDLQNTLDASKSVLKKHPKNESQYPELYFFIAETYKKMSENKNGDSGYDERALENYNLAIQYFPNYTQAIIARANFYISRKNDYFHAISDYDLLAANAPDDSPEKPGYFATKARWKVIINNAAGALDDYQKAITLSGQKVALYYFLKARYLYNTAKYDESVKYLDTAITSDPKYKDAYFYRGLNYSFLVNYDQAGSNFSEVEKLGYEPAQLQTVDSLANNLFQKGQGLITAHNFPAADSAFNNALKIKNCFAKALHSKAEIRFKSGNESRAKGEMISAKASFIESIDLNKRATKCDPNFSDAYYVEGLAQNLLGNNDLAAESYTEAIRSDTANMDAYIKRGNALQIQQKYKNAIADYQRANILLLRFKESARKASDEDWTKSITSNLSLVNQLTGQAQFNINNIDSAMLALNKAISINENNAEAYYYRGLVYMNQNEFSKAIKDLNTAIKLDPLAVKYYYADGKACLSDKEYVDAINNFSQVVARDTLNEFRNKAYLRGLAYFKNKMENDALTDYAAYDKLDVSKYDLAFYLDYGLAQLKANQDSAGVKSIKSALTLSPNNAMGNYLLGSSIAKGGKFTEALELFEKSFATHQITKEQIRPLEEDFLSALLKDKPSRTKYNLLKSTYLNSN